MSSRFCRACGTELGGDDRFCGSCGTARPAASSDPGPDVAAPVQKTSEVPFGTATTQAPQPIDSPMQAGQMDRNIVLLGLVSSLGFAVLWFSPVLRLLFNRISLKFDVSIVLSVGLLSFAGLGLAGAVAWVGRAFLAGKVSEQRVQFVALGSFAMAVIRIPTLLSAYRDSYSRNWGMAMWSDHVRSSYPEWFGWIMVFVSVTALAGLASFVLFVVSRQLSSMVRFMRPATSVIVSTVIFWLAGNYDRGVRFSGMPLVALVGSVLLAAVAVMLLLPGDFGPTVALFFLVAHASFAVTSVVARIIINVVLGDEYGVGNFAPWSSAFGQFARSAFIAGLCAVILQQSGGMRTHVNRIETLIKY